MAIKRKSDTLCRINSRIRLDQHKFIKAYAKKKKIGEGEAIRAIIDNYMMNV
jgi:hypothetical protein